PPVPASRSEVAQAYARARTEFRLPGTYRFTSSHAVAMRELLRLAGAEHDPNARPNWIALATRVNRGWQQNAVTDAVSAVLPADLPGLLSAARLALDVHGPGFTLDQLRNARRLADAMRADPATLADVLQRPRREPGDEVRISDLRELIHSFGGYGPLEYPTVDDVRMVAALVAEAFGSVPLTVAGLRTVWETAAEVSRSEAAAVLSEAGLAVAELELSFSVLGADVAAAHRTELEERLGRLRALADAPWRPNQRIRVDRLRDALREVDERIAEIHAAAVHSLEDQVRTELAGSPRDADAAEALRQRLESRTPDTGPVAVHELLAIRSEAARLATPEPNPDPEGHTEPGTEAAPRPLVRRLPGRIRYAAEENARRGVDRWTLPWGEWGHVSRVGDVRLGEDRRLAAWIAEPLPAELRGPVEDGVVAAFTRLGSQEAGRRLASPTGMRVPTPKGPVVVQLALGPLIGEHGPRYRRPQEVQSVQIGARPSQALDLPQIVKPSTFTDVNDNRSIAPESKGDGLISIATGWNILPGVGVMPTVTGRGSRGFGAYEGAVIQTVQQIWHEQYAYFEVPANHDDPASGSRLSVTFPGEAGRETVVRPADVLLAFAEDESPPEEGAPPAFGPERALPDKAPATMAEEFHRVLWRVTTIGESFVVDRGPEAVAVRIALRFPDADADFISAVTDLFSEFQLFRVHKDVLGEGYLSGEFLVNQNTQAWAAFRLRGRMTAFRQVDTAEGYVQQDARHLFWSGESSSMSGGVASDLTLKLSPPTFTVRDTPVQTGPAGGVKASGSVVRSLAASMGAGDWRSVGYTSGRRIYRLTMALEVDVRSSRPAAARPARFAMTAYVEVPEWEADRFERELNDVLSGVALDRPGGDGRMIVPADGPHLTDRMPPLGILKGRSRGASVPDMLGGFEKVVPRAMELIDQAFGDPRLTSVAPRLTARQRHRLERAMNQRFSVTTALPYTSQLINHRIPFTRLYQAPGGRVRITVRAWSQQGEDWTGARLEKGRIDHNPVYYDDLGATEQVAAQLGYRGGGHLELGPLYSALRRLSFPSFPAQFTYARAHTAALTARSGVWSALGFIYEGPLRAFLFGTRYHVDVELTFEPEAASGGTLAGLAAGAVRQSVGLLTGTPPQGLPTRTVRRHDDWPGLIRYLVPEGLSPLTGGHSIPRSPAPELGRALRRRRPIAPVTSQDLWGWAAGEPERLRSDDQPLEVLGVEELGQVTGELLEAAGIPPETYNDTLEFEVNEDQLIGRMLWGGPTAHTFGIRHSGSVGNRHAVVSLRGTVLRLRPQVGEVGMRESAIGDSEPAVIFTGQRSTSHVLSGSADPAGEFEDGGPSGSWTLRNVTETNLDSNEPLSGRWITQENREYRPHRGTMLWDVTVTSWSANALGSWSPRTDRVQVLVVGGLLLLRPVPQPPIERPLDVPKWLSLEELPLAAASDRMEWPRPDHTPDGPNPVLTMVRGVLRAVDEQLLYRQWRIVNGEPRAVRSGVPTTLQSLLQKPALFGHRDTLLGPGLVLHLARSLPGAGKQFTLVLRAEALEEYEYVDTRARDFALYRINTQRQVGRYGTTSAHSVGANFGSTRIPATGRAVSTYLEGTAEGDHYEQTTIGQGKIRRTRDVQTVLGDTHAYIGELRITATLYRGYNASKAAQVLTLGLADSGLALFIDPNKPVPVAVTDFVDIVERVQFPASMLPGRPPNIAPVADRVGRLTAATTPEEVLTGAGLTPFAVGRADILRRAVVPIGIDPFALRTLFDASIAIFSGTAPDSDAPAVVRSLMTATGMPWEAYAALLSRHQFITSFHLTLDDGHTFPTLVREDGPATDARGEAFIQTRLHDPKPLGWVDSRLHSETDHEAQNELLDAAGTTFGVSLDGGPALAPPSGNPVVPVEPSVSLGQSHDHGLTAGEQLVRSIAFRRHAYYLRVEAGVLVGLRISAVNERRDVRYGAGESLLWYSMDDSAEVLLDPETALARRMLSGSEGIPGLDHRRYLPHVPAVAPPRGSEAAAEELNRLRAALALPRYGDWYILAGHYDPAARQVVLNAMRDEATGDPAFVVERHDVAGFAELLTGFEDLGDRPIVLVMGGMDVDFASAVARRIGHDLLISSDDIRQDHAVQAVRGDGPGNWLLVRRDGSEPITYGADLDEVLTSQIVPELRGARLDDEPGTMYPNPAVTWSAYRAATVEAQDAPAQDSPPSRFERVPVPLESPVPDEASAEEISAGGTHVGVSATVDSSVVRAVLLGEMPAVDEPEESVPSPDGGELTLGGDAVAHFNPWTKSSHSRDSGACVEVTLATLVTSTSPQSRHTVTMGDAAATGADVAQSMAGTTNEMPGGLRDEDLLDDVIPPHLREAGEQALTPVGEHEPAPAGPLPATAQVPAAEGDVRPFPAGGAAGLNEYELQVLWHEVRRELRRNHQQVTGADAAELRERLPRLYEELESWLRRPLRRAGEAIAQIELAEKVFKLSGWGSSKEKEYWYLLSPPGDEPSDEQDRKKVLARGPYGFRLEVEERRAYLGPDGRYFKDGNEAVAAGGIGAAVSVRIAEVIPGLMKDVPGETYTDPDAMYAEEQAMDSALRGIPGAPGDEPVLPLKDILPPGWELTEEGAGWLIGPPPVGAPSGSHDQYNVGVPMAVGHPFLRYVLQRTWRDQSQGYPTRDNLADALDFADHIAARFTSYEALGYIPDDLRPVYRYLDLPDLAVQQLRMHAAMLYVHTAMFLSSRVGAGITKAYAAALLRYDPYRPWKELPERARNYLQRDQAAFPRILEDTFRSRFPDYDERHLLSTGEPVQNGGLLSLPFTEAVSLRNFVLAGVIGNRRVHLEDVIDMSVFEEFDRNGGTLPKAVLEIRYFVRLMVTAGESREYHKGLTDEIRRLYPQAVRLHNPTPEDLAAVNAARAELRRLKLPGQAVPSEPLRLGLLYRDAAWPAARRAYETGLAGVLSTRAKAFAATRNAISRLYEALSAAPARDAAPFFGTAERPVGSPADLRVLLADGSAPGLARMLDAYAAGVANASWYGRNRVVLPDSGPRSRTWLQWMRARGHHLGDAPLDRLEHLFATYRSLDPDTDDGRDFLAAVIAWGVPQGDALFDVLLAWERAGFDDEALSWALRREPREVYEWVDRQMNPREGFTSPPVALTPPHLQVYDRLVDWSVTPDVQRAAGAVGLAPREAAALQRVGTLPAEGTDALADVVWDLARRAVARLGQDELMGWSARWQPGEPESFPGLAEGARVSVPPILPVWPSPEEALAHVQPEDGPGWVVLNQVYRLVHAAGAFGEATGQGELYYLLDEGDLIVSEVRPHTGEWNGVRVVEVKLDSPPPNASAEDAMSLDEPEEKSSSASSSGDEESAVGVEPVVGLRGGAAPSRTDRWFRRVPSIRDLSFWRIRGRSASPAPSPSEGGAWTRGLVRRASELFASRPGARSGSAAVSLTGPGGRSATLLPSEESLRQRDAVTGSAPVRPRLRLTDPDGEVATIRSGVTASRRSGESAGESREGRPESGGDPVHSGATGAGSASPKLELPEGTGDFVPDLMDTIRRSVPTVPRRIAGRLPSLRPTDDEALTPERLVGEFGIPATYQKSIQDVADRFNLVLDVRPTNPDSVPWLERGALPKPQEIKAKTIGKADVHLGASEHHIGLVGYFQPRMPSEDHLDRLSTRERQEVLRRFEQRQNEFSSLAAEMAERVQSGRFQVRDGLVEERGPDGEFHLLAGDLDLYDVKLPDDGSRLEQDSYERTIWLLERVNVGIRHGAHAYWHPKNAFEEQLRAEIIARHRADSDNAVPLVRFAPGEPPILVFADDQPGPSTTSTTVTSGVQTQVVARLGAWTWPSPADTRTHADRQEPGLSPHSSVERLRSVSPGPRGETSRLRGEAPPAGVHASPSAPEDLRPAESVEDEDVYPLIPATDLDWKQRVLEAALQSTGSYEWSRSGPDPENGLRLFQEYEERPGERRVNDFARWLHGGGPALSSRSKLNCWEPFLYTAYWTGAVDRAWLEGIHLQAAQEASRAVYQARQGGESNRDVLADVLDKAYFGTLRISMTAGDFTRHDVDPLTELSTPDVPRGHLVFFGDMKHVAMALGTRDAQGRQEVLSHWNFPESRPGRPTTSPSGPGFLQRTTVEEIQEALSLLDLATTVTSAAPAWPVARTGADPRNGMPAAVEQPAAKVETPASPDEWLDRRFDAPVAKIATERYDPKITFFQGEPGTGAGWETLIRVNVQRIQAANGTWVRVHVITLPVKPMFGVTETDVRALQASLNRLYDKHVNRGYKLPRSGDQLFMAVKLVVDPGHGEAVEIRPGRIADAPDLKERKPPVKGPDARHWGLGDFLIKLAHESSHAAGLPDEYLDSESLFRRLATLTVVGSNRVRRTEPRSAVKFDGLMAGGPFDPAQEMPARYLERIESVVDATAVLVDHPLESSGAPAFTMVVTTEQSGAADTVASSDIYEVLGHRDDLSSYPAPSAPGNQAPPVPARHGSWSSAQGAYQRAVGQVFGADPAVVGVALEVARRLFDLLVNLTGDEEAKAGFAVPAKELHELLSGVSQWRLDELMAAIHRAVHHHHEALTELLGESPRNRGPRDGAWLAEMRGRGHDVGVLPPDQTEWMLRVTGRLGFTAIEGRSFLQAVMSWGIEVSQSFFDTLEAWSSAGSGRDLGFAVPGEVLAGGPSELHAWIDAQFDPRGRTRDPRLLADLTPPRLRDHGEPAAPVAEDTSPQELPSRDADRPDRAGRPAVGTGGAVKRVRWADQEGVDLETPAAVEHQVVLPAGSIRTMAPRLRPAAGVADADVYAFDPATVLSWTHRLVLAALGSIGFHEWTYSDVDGLFRLDPVTNHGTNHFNQWLRGEGPTPSSESRLNCWQAFLFTAYWSGAVDRAWLIEIHRDAARAAFDVVRARLGQPGVWPGLALWEAKQAYLATLRRSMTSGASTHHEVDPQTGLLTSPIPTGHLVFFADMDHVALSLGTRDAAGRMEVLSHWTRPEGAPGRGTSGPPGYLQKTTVEEIWNLMDPHPRIESAPPAWSTARFRDDPRDGVPSPVETPAAKVERAAGPEEWLDRRFDAPVAKVVTQRFDPGTRFTAAGPKDKSAGTENLIRLNVQRIQAANGTWVRNHVVVRPVKPMPGVTAPDITALQQALNRVYDAYVNRGYALPRSKDQLFMAVKLVIDPEHAEAVELRPGRTKDAPDLELEGPDARHWGLRDPLIELAHEAWHPAGLPDEYLDPASLFRRASTFTVVNPNGTRRVERRTTVKSDGLMAGGPFDPAQEMPARYLEIIESVVDATTNLRDHPLGASGTPRSATTEHSGVANTVANTVAGTELYEVLGRRDDPPLYPAPSAPLSARPGVEPTGTEPLALAGPSEEEYAGR
ncbi:hypothetical protein, partial [Actinoallomurus spadix]|uniref:hypothetical protein n=1 Tax=Actinoallomurus spadix TaxID=79912 RepID=UPI0031D16AFE